MSSTDRQNKLLISEDWKRVYQSFKNADFQSYDFDNLRRTMINYLRKNYPEDFNDYIESSEYLALIDLIAYLGQNLAFRADLNARENFLELAERRESVIRLARLLSYNPKRNQSANGLLKMESISTSEDIIDSNGNNLAGQTIVWNDVSNQDWYEQFIKVLNSALPANGVVGRPVKKDTVNGISAEQYRFNALNTLPDKLRLVAFTLLPVILPLTLNNPVTYSPVVANTATFDVPPIPITTLPPELTTRTFDVPFWILVASMPVS